MLKLFILAAIVFATTAALSFNSLYDVRWRQFKDKYHKKYKPKEESTKKRSWDFHLKEIIRHNLKADIGIYSYRMGLNEYSDMPHEEFVKKMNGYKQRNSTRPTTTFVSSSTRDLPDTVNWRKKGFVTSIKNQHECGSCWAFATTGSLEGQHKKETGELISLSAQNLVDCSGPKESEGCEGGDIEQGFDYIIENEGINTEKSYPYTAEHGSCKHKAKSEDATCTKYISIPSGDEAALKEAVATIGPISAAIDSSQESFQLYMSGIYDEPDCSSSFVDHGVLIVGYGTEDDVDYWLVKNSWGTSWGIEGYIKMSRNKDNQCGIATHATYPVI